ncbi:hypothetical protein BKP45_08700 [Anaerobacillus alkalidiazotrophicus]|uniref:DUF4306 domain-containing protein n=1 Tax=Anaerobacillus alkalidiazotrophicus TaxID=472963 RepID=A0A1S2M7P8_9BACI|nr:hypothetical protein [Anaerobacillus alkalidiazotrophicus]OIJ20711.1 hypothetical protein BKP45_08700 [Anaerobacillus alkalidiazotrophicus]
MKHFNNKVLGFSLLLCTLITMLIPSRFISDGMGRYAYGYPFTNITIYQSEPHSAWFGTNFFSGNDGLLINPLSIALNVIVIYLITNFIVNKYKKRKEIHQ